ncbi:hypothetical protein BKA61DRAFT_637492 [Leptodontidium sp. MPI-SDFR-AT-0119]|nr:hypothetical protein BKA61DRAFT_637492 [Leptodontidium sp. MPI-SDFR-AT-0119]
MPLLYGEGEAKAFRRLQEAIDKPLKDLLCDLPYTAEAPFNSYNRQHESTCHPYTRVDLLREIYDWCDGHDKRYIFWLNGLAGTGKSTIARTIARRCSEQGHPVASFFFSRGVQDVSHAGRFFTSLAVQLSNHEPSLHDQWPQLVLPPFSKLDSYDSQLRCILIIDALDECDNEDHVRTILQLLAEARSLRRVQLRVFLTSRPEIPIRHGIYTIPQAEHQDFVLHNIQPSIVDNDISLVLEYTLGIIGQQWNLGADWPGEELLRQLVLYASGLFIWASTTCRFIREGKRFARKRLDIILKGSSSAITAPQKHLDEIYLTVLKHSISSDYSDDEKEEACDMGRSRLDI